jgi:hypothetical protein
MYTRNLTIYVVMSLCFGLASEEKKDWPRNERELWLAQRRDWIERAKQNPDDESLINLSKILRGGVAHHGHSKEAILQYDRAKHLMLSTPGHAIYFSDRLSAARRKAEKPWIDNEYQMVYQQTRETLLHLPSPETVRVLGSMLESEEDLWSRDEIVAIWREKSKHGDYGAVIPSPRGFAIGVLQEIGLRDYPQYMSHEWKDVPTAWWEEIKSGQRTFSFKGQSVGYRFKPDGTWDTIPITNPPDDGPKPFSEKYIERPDKQTTGARKEIQGTALDFSWWLYGIVGSMLLALIAWFRSKKRTA